ARRPGGARPDDRPPGAPRGRGREPPRRLVVRVERRRVPRPDGVPRALPQPRLPAGRAGAGTPRPVPPPRRPLRERRREGPAWDRRVGLPCRGRRLARARAVAEPPPGLALRPARSEEHTSELQSPEQLVCRLLV